MTTDEFERILTALSYMSCIKVDGRIMLPIDGVVKVVHSQLRPEDQGLYTFDFEKNRWEKKDIS